MPNVIKYQFVSDTQKALAGMGKMIAKQEEQIQKLKEMNRQGKRTGKGMAAGAMSVAARWVSVGAAIGAAKLALSQFQQQSEAAAQGRLSTESNLKRIIQISGGDKAKFQGFMGTAAGLGTSQGIERDAALGAVFAGASLGFSNEQILQAGRWKRFVADITPLMEASAGLEAAFGAKALGGRHASRVNALLAGAERSKVGVEELSANVLAPAQAVKKLGGSAAETIAAVSVAAVALKSVEEAATAVGRFSDIMARDKKFKGKGLGYTLDVLSGYSEGQLVKAVGENIRAERGMRVLLENRAAFGRTLAEVNRSVAATGTERSRINLAAGLSGDVLGPMTRKQRAEAARVITEEEVLGGPKLSRTAVKDAVRAEMVSRGTGALRLSTVAAEMYIRELLGQNAEGMVGVGAKMLAYQQGEWGEEARNTQREILDATMAGNRLQRERNDQVRISGEPLE